MKRKAVTLAGVAAIAVIPSTVDGKKAPKATASTGERALASLQPGAILTAINYERQMAGIDPLTARPDFDDACTAHAGYMKRNGVLTHDEDASKDGASEEGAWAGEHSVLARNSAGFTEDPWKEAPFHEFQVLHPWLKTTGVGVSGTYACMVTLGDRSATGGDDVRLVTVPGTGQYIPPAQVARESPFVPGDEVGLPQGTKTGPHLYVYAVGPEHLDEVTVQSATLTAADDGSQVPLKWVDASSPRSGKYVDGGAILIPVTPLKEGTAYGLRVEAQATNAAGQHLLISRTTSFITGPDEEGLFPGTEASDSVTASSVKSKASAGPGGRGTTMLGRGGGSPLLAVSLAWSHQGVRATITCQSTAARCTGPMRVLVRRKGGHTQKLRFTARKGPLKVNLAPGRTIARTVKLNRKQRKPAHKLGFAVRWGGAGAVKAKAYKAH